MRHSLTWQASPAASGSSPIAQIPAPARVEVQRFSMSTMRRLTVRSPQGRTTAPIMRRACSRAGAAWLRRARGARGGAGRQRRWRGGAGPGRVCIQG